MLAGAAELGRGARRIPRLAAALVFALLGCNAVLGIRAPSPALLDGGTLTVAANGGAERSFDAAVPAHDAGGLEAAVGTDLPPALHAWAAWPMPNPVSTSLANAQVYKTDESGVVTDEVTHLQWQQPIDSKSYSWANAASYCAQLTIAGKAGFRLPSRIELVSLIDFTTLNPAIDAMAFVSTPAERFWSASPYAAARGRAWGINFGFTDGLAFQDDVLQEWRVRCVR
jgi:hypothetical protein